MMACVGEHPHFPPPPYCDDFYYPNPLHTPLSLSTPCCESSSSLPSPSPSPAPSPSPCPSPSPSPCPSPYLGIIDIHPFLLSPSSPLPPTSYLVVDLLLWSASVRSLPACLCCGNPSRCGSIAAYTPDFSTRFGGARWGTAVEHLHVHRHAGFEGSIVELVKSLNHTCKQLSQVTFTGRWSVVSASSSSSSTGESSASRQNRIGDDGKLSSPEQTSFASQCHELNSNSREGFDIWTNRDSLRSFSQMIKSLSTRKRSPVSFHCPHLVLRRAPGGFLPPCTSCQASSLDAFSTHLPSGAATPPNYWPHLFPSLYHSHVKRCRHRQSTTTPPPLQPISSSSSAESILPQSDTTTRQICLSVDKDRLFLLALQKEWLREMEVWELCSGARAGTRGLRGKKLEAAEVGHKVGGVGGHGGMSGLGSLGDRQFLKGGEFGENMKHMKSTEAVLCLLKDIQTLTLYDIGRRPYTPIAATSEDLVVQQKNDATDVVVEAAAAVSEKHRDTIKMIGSCDSLQYVVVEGGLFGRALECSLERLELPKLTCMEIVDTPECDGSVERTGEEFEELLESEEPEVYALVRRLSGCRYVGLRKVFFNTELQAIEWQEGGENVAEVETREDVEKIESPLIREEVKEVCNRWQLIRGDLCRKYEKLGFCCDDKKDSAAAAGNNNRLPLQVFVRMLSPPDSVHQKPNNAEMVKSSRRSRVCINEAKNEYTHAWHDSLLHEVEVVPDSSGAALKEGDILNGAEDKVERMVSSPEATTHQVEATTTETGCCGMNERGPSSVYRSQAEDVYASDMNDTRHDRNPFCSPDSNIVEGCDEGHNGEEDTITQQEGSLDDGNSACGRGWCVDVTTTDAAGPPVDGRVEVLPIVGVGVTTAELQTAVDSSDKGCVGDSFSNNVESCCLEQPRLPDADKTPLTNATGGSLSSRPSASVKYVLNLVFVRSAPPPPSGSDGDGCKSPKEKNSTPHIVEESEDSMQKNECSVLDTAAVVVQRDNNLETENEPSFSDLLEEVVPLLPRVPVTLPRRASSLKKESKRCESSSASCDSMKSLFCSSQCSRSNLYNAYVRYADEWEPPASRSPSLSSDANCPTAAEPDHRSIRQKQKRKPSSSSSRCSTGTITTPTVSKLLDKSTAAQSPPPTDASPSTPRTFNRSKKTASKRQKLHPAPSPTTPPSRPTTTSSPSAAGLPLSAYLSFSPLSSRSSSLGNLNVRSVPLLEPTVNVRPQQRPPFNYAPPPRPPVSSAGGVPRFLTTAALPKTPRGSTTPPPFASYLSSSSSALRPLLLSAQQVQQMLGTAPRVTVFPDRQSMYHRLSGLQQPPRPPPPPPPQFTRNVGVPYHPVPSAYMPGLYPRLHDSLQFGVPAARLLSPFALAHRFNSSFPPHPAGSRDLQHVHQPPRVRHSSSFVRPRTGQFRGAPANAAAALVYDEQVRRAMREEAASGEVICIEETGEPPPPPPMSATHFSSREC
eukprot:GHVS01016103.1.p1 GENE.GHVS01016103.1~~GHVS01016103.1.p1  ORF type:complete len:1466 (+),score=345.93 GHVS01016103.1:93-4490(+)